jgi:hypothetical protein
MTSSRRIAFRPVGTFLIFSAPAALAPAFQSAARMTAYPPQPRAHSEGPGTASPVHSMDVTPTTTVFFELGPYDRFHRQMWEDNLARWAAAATHVKLVGTPDEAEFIIETLVRQSFAGGPVFRVARESHYRRRPDDTFVWDGQDLPTGRLPGLYCSLPRRIYRASRHRSFCYPYRYNEHVAHAPPEEAKYLFGFSGSVTSPLRGRMFAALAPQAAAGRALLRTTEVIWSRIFTDEPRPEKLRYCDNLRQCKFVLCPRGNGVGSVRLFETLETGRVPVIISDQYVPPLAEGWSDCVVRVPERELEDLPRLLESIEPRWPAMAGRARVVWEQNFSDRVLLHRLVANLRLVRASRRTSERWMGPFFAAGVLPHYGLVRMKQFYRHLQSLRRPSRQIHTAHTT